MKETIELVDKARRVGAKLFEEDRETSTLLTDLGSALCAFQATHEQLLTRIEVLERYTDDLKGRLALAKAGNTELKEAAAFQLTLFKNVDSWREYWQESTRKAVESAREDHLRLDFMLLRDRDWTRERIDKHLVHAVQEKETENA